MKVTLNGVDVETDAATLPDLLEGPLPDGCAVAVNAEVVPRSSYPSLELAHGDEIEVVTAVAGG